MLTVARKAQRAFMLATATVLTAVSIPVSAARADILPAVSTPTIVSLGGGLWRWDYQIFLSNTQNVATGDFFVIYDFGPSSAVSVPTAGWVATSDPTSPSTVTGSNGTVTPTQTNALNWTFTWTGTTINGSASGSTLLGTFSLTTTTNQTQVGTFVGRGTTIANGQKNANITNTLVPVTTPEPASFVLLGTGLAGLGVVARRRRSK